ncbi:MAG TPA: hypothetical protein VJ946_02240, partial [Bacteroidales bacterium]|nr:hypothetical protein [Bacteroidales bacterium]
MKKILFSIFILLAVFNLKAQSYKFSGNIKWMGVEKVQIDSVTQIQRLSFQGAGYDDNHVPVYLKKIQSGSYEIEGYEFTSTKTIPLSDAEKSLLYQSDINLKQEFQVRFKQSTIKKQQHHYVELIPVRENPETGRPEKLAGFTIRVNTSPVALSKSGRNYAENSALNSGEWFKIRVAGSGMYEIPYSLVTSMGFANPSDIGVFGYGGMVPKLNSENRYDDLPERPVYLQDNNGNNSFDQGDALLVYLEGPDSHSHQGGSVFKHRIHNYSDYSYYFLSDDADGLRLEEVAGADSPNNYSSTYDYYSTLEKDSINIIGSGRNLYWRHFDYYMSYQFNLSVPNVVSSEPATLYSNVAARSTVSSRFKFVLNGSTHYGSYISAVSGGYSSAYAFAKDDTFEIPTPQSVNTIKVEYMQPESQSEGWLDYLTINARARLEMDGSSLRFRDNSAVGSGKVTQYTITGANANSIVIDVTDPVNAFAIEPDNVSGNELTFTASSETLREFVVFDTQASYASPQTSGSDRLGYVENQNLHGYSNVDYVIVTNSLFSAYAEQLAGFHQSYSGLSVL